MGCVSEWDNFLIKIKVRAIAIESFSSSAGFMTATPINEPCANVLADKNAYYSKRGLPSIPQHLARTSLLLVQIDFYLL